MASPSNHLRLGQYRANLHFAPQAGIQLDKNTGLIGLIYYIYLLALLSKYKNFNHTLAG